jgi:hypothetical protein
MGGFYRPFLFPLLRIAMASKIILKKSSVASKAPVAGDLDFGELAINYTDGKLYFKKADGNIDAFSTSSASSAGVTISESAPSNPNEGALWWNSATGNLNVFFDDGNSSQWVSASGVSEIINIEGLGSVSASESPYSNEYVVTGTTTDANETEIFVDGLLNSRIPVAPDTVCAYSIDIVAKRTDAIGGYAFFQLKSAASNTSSTVSNLGNVYEIIVTRTDPTIAVDARADDSTNSIGIFVTGVAGQTYTWRAVVNTVEV